MRRAGLEPASCRDSKSRRPCRQSNRPSRAAIRCRPGPPALQERGHSRVRRRALAGIRTRNIQHLGLASLPYWSTSTWSRHPGSNRATRRTKAEPQAVRGGEATGAGLEPACPWVRAKAGCLQPTRYRYGRRDSNAQATRFELVRSAVVASLPRAPPGTRTLFPGVRARCITCHACSAQVGSAGFEPAAS